MEQELVTCINCNLSLGIGRPLEMILGFQGHHWQLGAGEECVYSANAGFLIFQNSNKQDHAGRLPSHPYAFPQMRGQVLGT